MAHENGHEFEISAVFIFVFKMEWIGRGWLRAFMKNVMHENK